MPGISDLLDSDMEENNFVDENSLLSSDASDAAANTGNDANAKKRKKRQRVTMPKSKARVTKISPQQTAKKPSKTATATKKKALEEALETRAIAESQQSENDEDDLMEVEEKPKPKRKPAVQKATVKAKMTKDQPSAEAAEIEQTPMVARSNFAQDTVSLPAPKIVNTKKDAANKKSAKQVIEAPVEPIESITVEEIDEIAIQQPPVKRARTESRTRQEPAYRRRAGSASDTERGDPNLRRKLGDVTRKFENIDMKYKNLKEVGIGEANANVEKLRKQCEATTEASNNLISSLKKELSHQAPLLQDARKLKKELQARDEELAVLRTSQAEHTASLNAAQSEIKALQAKLAAARAASISTETQAPSKMPGSAMKASRLAVPANGEAAQAAQVAQMKLDLYGDLTGLIVRSVKRVEDGDTYDCIQTGRNGTLHFKLFVDREDAKSVSFEETEFLYTPLLDADRDEKMIEMMPPYLAEDITFARANAVKFYQRVVDTLTRRSNEG